MRNKFYTLLFIAGILSAVACSDDEQEAAYAEREIALSGASVQYLLSRADAAEPLSEDYKMWVTAVLHSEDNVIHQYYFTTASGNPEVEFAYDASSVLWKAKDFRIYFPMSGTMDFMGYAFLNAAHKPSVTYSPTALSVSEKSVSSMTLDFGNKLDATDPVVYSNVTTTPARGHDQSNMPRLEFKHALSKIVFTLRTLESEASSRFNVYGLTLKDVKTSGTLSITPSVASVASWTSVNNVQNVAIFGNSGKVLPAYTASASDLGTSIGIPLYLPTQLGSTQLTLDIDYSINEGDASYNETPRSTKSLTISLPANNWEPGCQYTYTLTVSLTSISVAYSTQTGFHVEMNPENIDIDEIY